MNWFRENPFWSAFIGVAGGALLLSLGLLWWTKGSYEDAMAQYRDAASAQTTLENGNPYPSAANVTKMKTYLDDYKGALDKLKAELKTHMLPESPLAPNEFQTHLRQAISQTMENARSHRVKLPANFFRRNCRFRSISSTRYGMLRSRTRPTRDKLHSRRISLASSLVSLCARWRVARWN